LDFDRDANLDTPYHYKDLRLLRHIQVDGSLILDDKINKHYSGSGYKPVDRKLGKLIRGLKQEGDFILGILISPLKVKR
jgi:DNA mismatch repair protein MutL